MEKYDFQTSSFKNSPAQERQKIRRRRNEFIVATFAFLLVLILTSVQVGQLHTGDALFMAVFNINFIILLGILFVVLRNAFKLLLERRRRVLGSRLRTRLVFAFVSLSILPCLLMFLVTTKYVQLSMDFWFKDQIETSMDAALDLARFAYDHTGSRLMAQTDQTINDAKKRRINFSSAAGKNLLIFKQKEYQLDANAFLTPDQQEVLWNGPESTLEAWTLGKNSIDWNLVKKEEKLFYLFPGSQRDYLFSVQAVDSGKTGYLLFAEDMGESFKGKLDRIIKGKGEYKNLRKLKQPLKRMLYSSLGVLTMLIILGAIWYAFRISREISAPVQALAAGTTAIAKGDLSIRLSDSSHDELGMLIRSFNSMAQDLEQKQRALTDANSMLEEQNIRIASHSKYIETVLNTIAAGVISFDHEGSISTVNQAACLILDLHEKELLGRQINMILPETHQNVIDEIRRKLRRRHDSQIQHTLALRIHEEEKRLLINVVGFATEGVFRGAVAVFEDISELERMQRTAAWREVAKRIAHEIKNPLTPIKLSAQRLARKFDKQVKDPAFTQSTQLIVQQVDHLLDMVQEFSAFAKLPEVKPMPGLIRPLLERLTALFQNSHSMIHWEINMNAELPSIPMDKEALQRAFMNIYANAAEALILSHAPQPRVWTQVSIDHAVHMLRIDVTDNGPGLTAEERSRLFEPYFSHKQGGTGLGLTIVRSIVADHRGYVRAFSRQGGGTVISMELPLN